ncbi:MAG: Hdr-like menaquinol oxidoreductase cytochrome c subunit [Gammaproteobacteria bacterium]|nr:Hdr-like menaquinol oxidoreductase cytochrome c subunit [Gammaproteobacteria bacterium]
MSLPTLHLLKGAHLLLLTLLLVSGGVAVAEGPSVPKALKGEQCVESVPNMRRNHMEYLKHHRVETMRYGVRTETYSLKKCLDCHVAPKAQNAAATDMHDTNSQHFCNNCHSYAGVKLDCFDCHAAQPDGQ